MPRSADRIVGHLMGQRGSTLSTMSNTRAPSFRSSVYLYRPSNSRVSVEGSSDGTERMLSSTARRIPITLTNRRHDSRTSKMSSIPDEMQMSSIRCRDNSTRMRMLASEDEFDGIDTASMNSTRRVSIQEGKDGDVEIVVEDEEPVMFTVFENIDGIRHLFSDNRFTRYSWAFLIGLFVCLCFYQITTQVLMFWFTPIATNIAATYPQSVAFPVVAICNNNQFRLTYLTGDFVQNRIPKYQAANSADENSTNIFEKALLNTWDLGAVKFMQSAGHSRFRMILKCQWPNGTQCKSSDFKPLWTLNGLCYAINTDHVNPVHVNGGGLGNALKLLLNVERYERIESCTPNFRTDSLPGLKILIFNQSDVPVSNLEGVNVPPGYTMDIPFRMQRRQKLPGRDCVEQPWNSDGSLPEFDSPSNARSCIIRSYLDKIEQSCKCSLRAAFNSSTADKSVPQCTVISYFSCAVNILKKAYENGFRSFECLPTCEQIDYTAWQDMNELPGNIFPKLIDAIQNEESAEGEIDDTNDEESIDKIQLPGEQHFKCELNQILDDIQIKRIKRDAQSAYEKQTRFQDDILIRTQRLMSRIRQTAQRLKQLNWGWQNDNFVGVQERLRQNIFCYSHIIAEKSDLFHAIDNIQFKTEGRKVAQLNLLISLDNERKNSQRVWNDSTPHSIGEIRQLFGVKAESAMKEIDVMELLLKWIFTIFDAETFTHKLPRELDRMDKTIQLLEQYDSDKLTRRAWAERMQTRNMKHFFDEEFYENWYNLVAKDLDVSILKTSAQISEILMNEARNISERQIKVGSILLFDDFAAEHLRTFHNFIGDVLQCTLTDIHNESHHLLSEFKGAMHDFQSAYEDLFRKELPEYLQNFEFGSKFVRENFAQVNVFLHKMNVEHWVQEPTYSIYSLFCDVGGTLGLFLNASLLTIIEIAYFVFDSKIYRKIFQACHCGSTNSDNIRLRKDAKNEKHTVDINSDNTNSKTKRDSIN